jgi:hypothetical protein
MIQIGGGVTVSPFSTFMTLRVTDIFPVFRSTFLSQINFSEAD